MLSEATQIFILLIVEKQSLYFLEYLPDIFSNQFLIVLLMGHLVCQTQHQQNPAKKFLVTSQLHVEKANYCYLLFAIKLQLFFLKKDFSVKKVLPV